MLHRMRYRLLTFPAQTPSHTQLPIGRSMTIRLCFIAGVAALTLFAGQAAADICADPQDQIAVRTKTLQTELMVAALRCDGNQRYNTFVHKFEQDLVVQGVRLRGYFKRAYGASAERRLNRFVTFLANSASLRSLDVGRNYCASAQALFDEVLDHTPGALAQYASNQRVDVAESAQVCARVTALIEK